ncbi:hypothetical protein ILYODFUR_035428 [Ilyodon furcidens]|uniref:Uncharacterized protein n=1 Tax=Ilyodon furcidens TaxID=33524 RepID=A0ABV0UXV8_9TELE
MTPRRTEAEGSGGSAVSLDVDPVRRLFRCMWKNRTVFGPENPDEGRSSLVLYSSLISSSEWRPGGGSAV